MNAHWLEKLFSYKNTDFAKEAMVTIVVQKIKNQEYVLSKHGIKKSLGNTAKNILIREAVSAKKYWHEFGKLLPVWVLWGGRAHGWKDIGNTLLDIGYHFLTEYIKREMERLDIPYEVGLLHKAQSKKSAPLAYDFVEWTRYLVDMQTLAFLRQKKKILTVLSQKNISHFIVGIKKELARVKYHAERKSCITYAYWIELNLLELRGSVSEGRSFNPVFPPHRHDTRCKRKSTQ